MTRPRISRLFLLCLPFLACGQSGGDDDQRGLELVPVSVDLEELAACISAAGEPGDLGAESKVNLKVTGYTSSDPASYYQKTYSFGAADDVRPGDAPLRFEFDAPAAYSFEVSFSAISGNCLLCAECESTCSGKASLKNTGKRTFGPAAAGQHLSVSSDPSAYSCACQAECRSGAAGGAGGNGGSAGTSQGGSAGTSSFGGSGAVPEGGSAGAGGEGPLCGEGTVIVGEYATWCGKVNVHTTESSTWASDSDCSSGCNVTGLDYCQKFWPTATVHARRSSPTSELKAFQDAGCASAYSSPGEEQYVCCAPL